MWQDIVAPQGDMQWDAATLAGCDPYLIWQEACGSLTDEGGEVGWALLIELVEPDDFMRIIKRGQFLPTGFEQLGRSRFLAGVAFSRRAVLELVDDVRHGRVHRFALQEARRSQIESLRAARALVLDILGIDLKSTRAPGGPWLPPSNDASAAMRVKARSIADDHAPRRTAFLGIVDDALPVFRAPRPGPNGVGMLPFWDQGWLPTWTRRSSRTRSPAPGPTTTGTLRRRWPQPPGASSRRCAASSMASRSSEARDTRPSATASITHEVATSIHLPATAMARR